MSNDLYDSLMNMVIGEGGIADGNKEKIIILEIELDADIFDEIFNSFDPLLEQVITDRKIKYEAKDGVILTLLISRGKGSGGRLGNNSKHAARIKITKPNKFNNLSISIPSPDENKLSLNKISFDIEGNIPKGEEEHVKEVQGFIKKNRFDLGSIFYTDKDYSARQSMERLIRRNDNLIITPVVNPPENDEIYQTYLKQEEKRHKNDNKTNSI